SEYKQIAARVAMKRREREAYLNECIAFLQQRLTESEVVARVIGRPKHLYSMYQKMVRQGKDFDQVMDIEGLRIITQTVSGCYNALGSVHSIWTPIPGRFKDYIAMPKLNMYQAIHTTVMREGGKPLEIQIRTEDMDRTAREGIAAHWVYKEGSRQKDQRLDEQLQWLRQMYEWLQEAHAPDELMETVRRDFNVSHVYVFTPKGEVKELPMGATPLDFAYAVHSHIGHHCIGARVNDRMVPLRYNLQTGDIVEILTSKNQHPHKDWVDVVVTGRARTKIRQKLREIGELEPADPVELKAKSRDPRPEPRPEARREARITRPPRPVRLVDDATRQKLIRIQGAKGMHTQFAKCCNPMPGHAVLGYVTKSCVITVHRADCKHFAKSQRDADRIIAAGWEGEGHFETGVRVVIGARPNVLADITNALRPLNIDITKARFEPGTEGKSYFDFIFDADDERGIDRVVRTLNMVQGVTEVQTLEVRELEARQLADVG
ncbi:MAG: bifunctional (p)ppGpp synthetase/guanosine-3',5'-bis(diphosphate) 3'-pyrophosphohydrolase, partial [Candidatus Hydrogenedentes bacterium]|nr:bifunctional (p)ppGpp synthetase/guanosine-3',5'-bis(diphosphate) 3'-pyrophosphohydrolase [Candidatus Hydrogenedentota bacterium]